MPAKPLMKPVAKKPLLQKKSNIQLYDNDVDNLLSDDDAESSDFSQHQAQGNTKNQRRRLASSNDAEEDQQSLIAELKEANARTDELRARALELEEAKEKDKAMQNKDKALEAAVKIVLHLQQNSI